ncbi:MAG: YfiR family protein [Bacteroidia bacterium]|nr:YfiR family protein [Bacteroidia bacterium]
MRIHYSYRCLLILALLCTGAVSLSAQDKEYKSYSLFIYNFIKYIEWPSTGQDFVIGVVGDSPIIKELESMAKAKKAKGRPIIIKKISTADEALQCQLVYVPPGKSSMTKSIAEKIKGKPVLLVGEREGQARKGAAMSFVTMDDDTLKFEFNQAVLEQNGLKMPSALSKLGLPV